MIIDPNMNEGDKQREVRAAALEAAFNTLGERLLRSGAPEDYVLQVAKRYEKYINTGSTERSTT